MTTIALDNRTITESKERTSLKEKFADYMKENGAAIAFSILSMTGAANTHETCKMMETK